MRNTIFFVTTALIFLVLGGMIWKKEADRKHGRILYLRLAPVDPRSLMQGDYMVIRYHATEKAWAAKCYEKGNAMILSLDQKKRGRFMRCATQGQTTEGSELLLSFQPHPFEVRIGAESFFFQEGRGKTYEKAAYGKLIVNPQGKAMLLDLVDKNLQPFYPDSAQKYQTQKQPNTPQNPPKAPRKELRAPQKRAAIPTSQQSRPSSQQSRPPSQQSIPTSQQATPTTQESIKGQR